MDPASVREKATDIADAAGFEVVPTVEVWHDRDEARLAWWIRLNLALVGTGLAVVFVIAALLHPYSESGAPLTQETHRQLGLPPCNFYSLTGLPCPSCGFTTSFSLLAHLDPLNSLRANSVGALLAGFCFMVMPWAFWSAWRGRYLWVRSAERILITSLIVFVVLMMTRWGIILLLAKLQGRF
jgi:hypothetical protein